jgi:hypothetical protein
MVKKSLGLMKAGRLGPTQFERSDWIDPATATKIRVPVIDGKEVTRFDESRAARTIEAFDRNPLT